MRRALLIEALRMLRPAEFAPRLNCTVDELFRLLKLYDIRHYQLGFGCQTKKTIRFDDNSLDDCNLEDLQLALQEIRSEIAVEERQAKIRRAQWLERRRPRIEARGKADEIANECLEKQKKKKRGWFLLADGEKAKPLFGVYALYDERMELKYIGQAINLRNRLRNGHHTGWSFSRPCYIKVQYCRPGDHLAREYRLITRLHPPNNVKLTPRDKVRTKRGRPKGRRTTGSSLIRWDKSDRRFRVEVYLGRDENGKRIRKRFIGPRNDKSDDARRNLIAVVEDFMDSRYASLLV